MSRKLVAIYYYTPFPEKVKRKSRKKTLFHRTEAAKLIQSAVCDGDRETETIPPADGIGGSICTDESCFSLGKYARIESVTPEPAGEMRQPELNSIRRLGRARKMQRFFRFFAFLFLTSGKTGCIMIAEFHKN